MLPLHSLKPCAVEIGKMSSLNPAHDEWQLTPPELHISFLLLPPILWILANRSPHKPGPGNLCNDCFLLSQGPEWGQPSCGRPEDLRKRVLVIACEVKEIPGAPLQLRGEAPGVKYITTGCQRSPSPGLSVGRKMMLFLQY